MEHYVLFIDLLTLTLLEIILGIDNLIFLSIVSGRLPRGKQKSARKIGLSLALIARYLFLMVVGWIVQLTTPLFVVFSQSFSVRDIFLLMGGLFLLTKGTWEIHHEMEANITSGDNHPKKFPKYFAVIAQIVVFDLVFSLDSILTAVGLTQYIWIMGVAITVSIIVMMVASEPVSQFIQEHPTVKMLALSFLLLIGMVLISDGFGYHIPRGYIYFSVCFSFFVEFLNVYRQRKLIYRKNS